MLSEAECDQISAAVTAAEKRSAGEIVTIVAERSDAYHDVALHWAILAMLLTVALVALLPDHVYDRIVLLAGGWGEIDQRGRQIALLIGAMILAFLVVRLLLGIRPLRDRLIPKRTAIRRVRRRAVDLFRAAGRGRTTGRTAILLYLSLAERRAELVVDETILARVDQSAWEVAMTTLVEAVRQGRASDGMVAAVDQIGDVLAVHCPRSDDDKNELPDRVITL
jgi:putative membrane protein